MTTAPEATASNPIDVYVGQRVRERRRQLKLSQQAVSDELDISFQQVQKYERGSNRISASKLFGISQMLRVPMDYFFEGLPAFDLSGHVAESKASEFLQSAEGIELVAAFVKLSPAKRRLVIATVRGVLGVE